MGDHALDPKIFLRHLKTLRDMWESAGRFVDSFVVVAGASSDEAMYTKTLTLQSWLCGYEMTDTILIITQDLVCVFTTPSKAKLFETLSKAVDVRVQVLKRDRKQPELDKQHFGTLLGELRSAGTKVGTLNDPQLGEFAASWRAHVAGAEDIELVDIDNFLSDIFAVKDSGEEKYLKTAASITTTILKNFLVRKVEDIIDKERKVPHNKIADMCDDFFQNAGKISSKLDAKVVDSCYVPIVQSGGNYNLQLFAANNTDALDFGTIIVSLGGRYKQYCCDVARTFFVDPNEEQEKNYSLLLQAFETALKAIKPGATFSSVYAEAEKVIKDKNPVLLPHFLSNCGFSTGIQFADSNYTFSPGCTKVIKKGMVVFLRLGLDRLPIGKTVYSILISDTVLLKADEDQTEVLTDKCTKNFTDISYEIGEPEEKERSVPIRQPKLEVAETKGFTLRKREVLQGIEVNGRTVRKTAQRELLVNNTQMVDSKREEHQRQLEAEMVRAAKRALKQKKKGTSDGDVEEKKKKHVSYSNSGDFPQAAQKDKIFVDANHESVLLPIYGQHVPFHISTVKNVTKTEDILRINFKFPGGAAGDPSEFSDPKATFIKEMTFRITNAQELNYYVRSIAEVKKRVQQRETEIHQKMSLKTQPALILSKGRVPSLAHLNIRPNISGNRQTSGTLEAHSNGFRFHSKLGNVDIIYTNVKHCFFQPADNSLVIVLHFHLHNDIMVGKRKIKDIQFYTEVMEASQAVTGTTRRQSRWGEAEEIEDEQRERALKNKLNREFDSFTKKVQDLPEANLEFDMPYRELGFMGVPSCNNILLQPTVHCLINVIEYPPFVMTLDEVQIAYFERVQFSLATFDLVFIFKDWDMKEVRLSAVPSASLESIKEWLDSCNIKYYQGKSNVNWKQVLSRIKVDSEKFWEEGGWSVLEQEEEDERSVEGSEEYNPSSESSGDHQVQDYSDSDDGSGYSEDSGGEESDEEVKGVDWDDLDATAENYDRQKAQKRRAGGDEYDSDEEGRMASSMRRAPPARTTASPRAAAAGRGRGVGRGAPRGAGNAARGRMVPLQISQGPSSRGPPAKRGRI